MVDAGIADVLVANELVGAGKMRALAEAARESPGDDGSRRLPNPLDLVSAAGVASAT